MANHSFDIFDTLISRKFANHNGVFVAVREKLKKGTQLEFPDYFIDEFVDLRLHSEKMARENSSFPAITMKEIYSAMGSIYPEITMEHLVLLQELEESIEIENCYAIPENVENIVKLIASGNKVFLISDIYLSKTVILQMLEKADARLCSLPIYLSSELKMSKSDGTLLRHVCKDQKIELSSLIHTGNNFTSDCIMAKLIGAKYSLYKDAILSKVEKSYFKEDQNLFLQLVAGASKRARLEGYDLKPSYRLGASFMGPMFYGFVHDLLKQAVNEGIKRIYFLARDGYLLKIIAEEIITYFKFDIEIRYLYTSRQSTYFASIFRVTAGTFSWIFQEMDNFITFNVVAKRLQFTADSLIDYLDADLKQSLISHGFDNRLTSKLQKLLQEELLGNTNLKAKIESEAKIYREAAIGYFEQEGLFQDERVGFVDIGWKGTLQDAIFRILKSKKPHFKLTSYYLAVTHFSALTSVYNRKIPAFMFPSTRSGIGPILELLLQCNHGTTVKYHRSESGQIEPILKDPPKHLEDWGVDSYKKGVQTFSRILSQSLAAHSDIETTYSAVTPILIELLEDATPEVASILGDLYYSGNIEESNVRRFAPPFNVLQALGYIISSRKERGRYTQWLDASYSRSGMLPRIVVKLDPRINFSRFAKTYISRAELQDKKQNLKRYIQLQLSGIRK